VQAAPARRPDRARGPAGQSESPAAAPSYGRAGPRKSPIADPGHGQAGQRKNPIAAPSYGRAGQRKSPAADPGHGQGHGHGSCCGRQDAGRGQVRRHPGRRGGAPRSSLRDRPGGPVGGHRGSEPNCGHHAARSDPVPDHGHVHHPRYPLAGTCPPTESWPGHGKRHLSLRRCPRRSCRSAGLRHPTRHADHRRTYPRTRSWSCYGTDQWPRSSCRHPEHRHRRRYSRCSGPGAPRRSPNLLASCWNSPGAAACGHSHHRARPRRGAGGHPKTRCESCRACETPRRRQARGSAASDHRPT
jgi:hypothetical protein